MTRVLDDIVSGGIGSSAYIEETGRYRVLLRHVENIAISGELRLIIEP